MPGATNEFGDTDDGEAPWHDQTLPLPERMTMAEGRPLRRRMMAAMAQQDCGQCGYNCEDYSNLIVAKKEERLNLCVPGGKETARMLKSLYEEVGKAPARSPSLPQRRRSRARSPADERHHARQSGDRHLPLAHAAQSRRLREGDLAHRDRSCRHRPSTTRSATRSASSRSTIPRWSTRSSRRSTRRPDFPIGGRTLREVLTDGVSLVARARHAVPALFVSHRRRAAAEGEGARGRRRPGRRRRDARRARRDREVSRRPPRPGSLHRGARSAAAAALFDLVLAEDQSGPRRAHRRHRALQDRQARAPRRRVDLPRRAHPAESAPLQMSTCRRRTPSGCPPIRKHRSS